MTSYPVQKGPVPTGPGQFWKAHIPMTKCAKFQPLLKKCRLGVIWTPTGTGQVVRRAPGPGQVVPGKSPLSVVPVVRFSDDSEKVAVVPVVRFSDHSTLFFCGTSCPPWLFLPGQFSGLNEPVFTY